MWDIILTSKHVGSGYIAVKQIELLFSSLFLVSYLLLPACSVLVCL